MDRLPLELIDHIGSYLSAWDRYRFRWVCHDYYGLFQPPSFYQLPPVERQHAGRLLRVLKTSPGVIDGSPLVSAKQTILMAVCRDLNLSLTVLGQSAMFIQEYQKLAQTHGITDVRSGDHLDPATWEDRVKRGTLVVYASATISPLPSKYWSLLSTITQHPSRSRIIYQTPIIVLDVPMIYTILTVVGIITTPLRFHRAGSSQSDQVTNRQEIMLQLLVWCCQRDPELAATTIDLSTVSAESMINLLFLHYVEPFYCRHLPPLTPP
jgi:hypothetical protein